MPALDLPRRARRSLGVQRPAVADAWLSSVEALAQRRAVTSLESCTFGG
ncbi:hypothetical protein [Streptomyces piniterrae]|nr:hypothetical protein [Streptomyces piniterrae]